MSDFGRPAKRYLIHNNHWVLQTALNFNALDCVVCLNNYESMIVNSQGQARCKDHEKDHVIIVETSPEGCVF